MSEETPIELYDSNDEGVIVLNEDGKLYTNQTGGVCCNHPTARGLFHRMAIPREIQRICYDSCGLTDKQLDQCDEAFVAHRMIMRVDRTQSSEEAWLHVDLEPGLKGILTWENSD